MWQDISLFIVSLLAAFVYVLRVFENNEHKSNRASLIRRSIIGSIGSMISVAITFYLLQYIFNTPVKLALAIAGGVGYMGADIVSRLAEKLIAQLIDKYTRS